MIYFVIALLICLIALGALYLRERGRAQLTIQRNTAIEHDNQELQIINQSLKEEYQDLTNQCANATGSLSSIKDTIKVQENILNSYKRTTLQLEEDAKQRAQQSYEAAAASLAQEYDKKKEALENELQHQASLLLNKIEQEQSKLKDIEDKQFAYIQAKQREEEIQAQKDYYRLVLDDGDAEEIKMLRNLQIHFSRKEAIDKLIWESYYKTPYDLLMSHIFENNAKVCGIYKITNLENGQAYIGQSVDIRERFRQHIKSALTSGPTPNKLYQQMKKYGPENFSFEVLELIDRAKLNEREIYWIEFYKTKELGMNGTKGGS